MENNTLRALMDVTHESLVLLDKDGLILLSNNVAAQRLGRTVHEFVGTCLWDHFPPEVAKERKGRFDTVIKTGQPIHCEDNRAGRFFEMYYYPVVDSSGKVSGCAIFAHDITEKKFAGQELAESQRLLSGIFNAMQDLLLVLDKDLRIIVSNWKDHEYVKQEEREGNPYCYRSIMHRDTPCEPCHALEVFSTGKIKSLEHTNVVDGKTREIKVYPIFDASGNVAMVTEHVRDITDRKKAGESLKAAENMYRNLFTNALEGIYRSAPGGKLVIANPAFAKILGYDSPEEAIAKLTDLKQQVYVNPEEREIVVSEVERHGLIKDYETKFYRKDGARIWVRLSATAIRDDYGNIQHYEGMIQDITKNKETEQQLLNIAARQKAMLEMYRMTNAPLDAITGFVVEESLKLSQSELAFIGYINKDETFMHAHLWSRKAMEICSVDGKPVVFPLGQGGLWAEAVRQKKPIIVNCYSEPNPFKKGCPEGHVPLTSFTGIPLIKNGRAVLVAGLANKKEPYNESDVTNITILLEGMWNYVQWRRSEEDVRNSEVKYRSIFDNAVEGIFQTTMQGQFLSANPAMARMLGYDSPEELISSVTNIGEQLYANPEERLAIIKELKENDIVKGLELQQRRKDGSLFWILANVRAVKDEKGDILCFEGTYEDITLRKLAEESLQQTLEKLRKSLAGTIQAMSLTVETRDPYTAGHQRRVSNLARAIAQEMNLPNDAVDTIRMAGIVHDIGKISVPAEILSKPGKLTDIEMRLIKVHPQSGYDILKDVELPYPIAETVLQHHERLDGSGYPQGLKADRILLEARIISVADVVEAITSYRPYRPGFGIDVALQEIEKNKGILYDDKVVEVCVRLFREKGFVFESTVP